MLEIANLKSHTGEPLDNQMGVFCFLDSSENTLYVNACTDIKKGRDRHHEKLCHHHHRVPSFLESYNCGHLSFTYFPTDDWETATTILNNLLENKQYKVVRL